MRTIRYKRSGSVTDMYLVYIGEPHRDPDYVDFVPRVFAPAHIIMYMENDFD